MTTPNDEIDPVAAAAVTNNDTRGLPPYPSLQRITRTDAVGVSAANKQHKAIERRTDTLLDRLNSLITAHNLNASNVTAYFLKRAGGLVNAMQGILHMGDNKITDLGAASSGDDAPRADQALTSLGLNVGDLDANGGKIVNGAPGVLAGDFATVSQLTAQSASLEIFVEYDSFRAVNTTVTKLTANQFEWVVPAGVTYIWIRGCGAGGGGGDNGGAGFGAGGGSSAYESWRLHQVTPGDLIIIGIGNAGFGTGSASGTAGASSTVTGTGLSWSALGGQGGPSALGGSAVGPAAVAVFGKDGIYTVSTAPGKACQIPDLPSTPGLTDGADASGYGAGGGGGSVGAGGDGSRGFVHIRT